MIYEKRGTSVCISQFQIFKRVTKEEVYQYLIIRLCTCYIRNY